MTMLSVVIPAWNEEDGIQEIMGRVLAIRPDLPPIGVEDLELIVVDDGSSDRTAELVAACEGARLIQHEVNGGYGAALKTGFAAAQGEFIGFLDADGTYPPSISRRCARRRWSRTQISSSVRGWLARIARCPGCAGWVTRYSPIW